MTKQEREVEEILEAVVELSNGTFVVNCCRHSFEFEDGTVVEPSGFELNCDLKEKEWAEDTQPEHLLIQGGGMVTLRKVPRDDGLKIISDVYKPMYAEREGDDILLLASMFAAEAYGYPVVNPRPTDDTMDRNGRNKIMCVDRFTGWPDPQVRLALRMLTSGTFTTGETEHG
jgi:hypothetical protein